MAFTRSGVRSPSPPLPGSAGEVGAHSCAACTPGVHRGRLAPTHAVARQELQSRVPACRIRPLAGIAQLVEHNLAKVGVAGSSPVSRSPEENVAGWSSLVARRAHNPEVVGSNPTPAMAVPED